MGGDYISREAAKKEILDLHDCYNGFSDTYDKACIVGALEEVPTADVVEVRHGRWYKTTENIGGVLFDVERCTVCGVLKPVNMFPVYSYEFSYCPNCGAKMGERRSDERVHSTDI